MRKTKKKAPPKRRVSQDSPETLLTLKKFLDQIIPDYTDRLKRAEDYARKADAELQFLKNKLEGLLTVEQMETAKMCQMEPALYALNWIELQTEGKLDFQAPSFPKFVRNLRDLKEGTV